MEEPDNVNEETSETSEAEDFLVSDSEDTPSLNQDVLKIDYSARLIHQESTCENDGDDCDMRFVDKNSLLVHRGSDADIHTSTEDLNFSEDEENLGNALKFQSVNLDGMASTSAKNNAGSLSTLNYSHTVFKKEYPTDAEYLSGEELGNNMKGNLIKKDKLKSFLPEFAVSGIPSRVKRVSPPRKALNVNNMFTNSLLLDEDVPDLQDEKESPPMTCLEFLKSEFSDGNNTDAEDISVGSLDDILEAFKNDKTISIKDYNAVDITGSGDSRRSSTAGFHTEDEIFSMENFPDNSQTRVKKRHFRTVEKSKVSADSDTEEELL